MAIVIGTNNSETLDASDGVTGGDDLIHGLGGNDTIYTLDGNDIVYGGSGNDDILGENGIDTLFGESGNDDLVGGADEDHLVGGAGADDLDGGADYDYAIYTDSAAGVIVNLETGLGDGGTAVGDTLTDIENLIGSAHNDALIGDDTGNWFAGEDGDDTLQGDDGDDSLYGDSPAARFSAGSTWSIFDFIWHNELAVGNDTLKGGGGDDYLNGGNGNDTLRGGGGADDLWGDEESYLIEGNDTAAYNDSAAGVTVSLATGLGSGGDAEGDELWSIENLTGSGYADDLDGDDGANELRGLDGNDTLSGGDGDDTLDGGAGVDTATYTDSIENVTISLLDGTGAFGARGDTFISIENLTGSSHTDWLGGDDGANVLDGRGDDDTLEGAGGADTLYGRSGDDELEGGRGEDTVNGDSGIDTASYASSSAGVSISLLNDTAAGGDAAGDQLDSIENLAGSEHADVLSGDNNANFLAGLDGNNTLYGYGGGDDLWGGNDTDTLFGMGGIDILKGFGGDDTLDGGANADTMLGDSGDDTYYVDNAADVVTEASGEGTLDRLRTSTTYSLAAGSEVEILETTDQAGTTLLDLVGNEFDNTIIGNDGQNTIVGSPDTDGGGYDGLDTMTGFGGGDVFVWTSTAETGVAGAEADVVTDFDRAAGDLLAFNPIDADGNAGNGDTAFTFTGVSDGSFDAPGQISYFTADGDGDSVDDTTYILLNTDADATQEATIRLNGAHTVDASWFVL
jgi:Ca2+-binding RTX toxin-like protein